MNTIQEKRQITDTILMVRPVGFRMNEQTAVNNFFQEDLQAGNVEINLRAQGEFDQFVALLEDHGVKVICVEDSLGTDTPDSIFPNNWVSFHGDGTVCLYPMFAKNRRRERREDILERIEKEGFVIEHIMDYTAAEAEGVFLEGTGSILMDRLNQKAYCALSQRADEDLFIEFCEDFDCFPVLFTANQTVDGKRLPIYHTNVMMALGERFAVIAPDTVDDKKERKNLLEHLKMDGREIIEISEGQMYQFAGNMLQLLGAGGQPYMVMSSAAYHSLDPGQIKAIEKHCPILHSPLDTIETCGGGSARCMMAEVFLPRA